MLPSRRLKPVYVCLAKTKKEERFSTGPSSIVVIVLDYKNSIHYIYIYNRCTIKVFNNPLQELKTALDVLDGVFYML